MLTAEQIADLACKKSETILGTKRIINRMFRSQDDSDKWPISGKFNVTERAIRHGRKFSEGLDDPLAYALFLEEETSKIVNDERNW